jgi:hypothetical protein
VLYSLLCLVIFQYFVGAGAAFFFACNKLFLHSDVVDIVPVLLKRDEDPAVAAFHVQELFSRATERYCDVPRPECYYLSIF